MKWLRYFRRSRRDQESAREIECYLDQETEDNLARGMSPEDARAAARKKFGNPGQVREEIYRMNSIVFLETIWQDLVYALRTMRKNPAFAATAVLTLALGIGANTAVFSIVDAVLIRPLPYKSPRTLIRIEETSPKRPLSYVAAQDYLRWSSRSDLFEKTIPYLKDMVTLSGIPTPDQVFALRSSGALFPMLGVRARMGRALLETDDDSSQVAVLSDHLWRHLFHADPQIVGRTITISDEAYTIVGVMPREFEFPSSDVEMWLPLRLTAASTNSLQVLARMKQGRSIPQIQAAMQIVAHQLEQEDPLKKAGLQVVVSLWREEVPRKYELSLVFILTAVGLVLLIACADVGSLLLSRALQRQKEIAIRASLGAGFWRVARQLLAESLVLAVFGSAAGIAMARYALQELLRRLSAMPIPLPHLQRATLDERVLLFNMGLCVVVACVLGVLPVFLAARTDLQAVLRTGQSAGRSRTSTRLFSVLIASEAAFAFLLLAGSSLMIRSLIRLEQADHGFHPDHVLTMRVPIGTTTQPRPTGKYDTASRQMDYYRELIERLQRVPGVRYVAVVNNLPLSHANTAIAYEAPDGTSTLIPTRTISDDYFAAMGIPLLRGRAFVEQDQSASAPRVCILNEHFARRVFPDRDPVGQILPGPGSIRIVGVAKDSAQMSYDEPVVDELYLPYRQKIFGTFLSTIVVRTSVEPLALATALQKEVWAADPNQPILDVETMNDVITNSIWRPRFSAWIFTVFATLALLLAAAGIYGVVAYTTTLRAREVGIRVALGATRSDVIALILREVMLPLGCGIFVSLMAGLFLSHLLSSILYEISGSDPVTYLGSGTVLLLIGAIASARPAWKAASVDPVQVLRIE